MESSPSRREIRGAWVGAALAALVVLGSPGCGRKPTSGTWAAGDPAAVLSEATELVRTHRVEEALAVLDGYVSRRPAGSSWSEAELPLRELRASLLVTVSRPAEAAEILEQLAALRPDDAALRLRLARARTEEGAPDRALAEFERLPADRRREALLDYGRALVGVGRLEDGATVLAASVIRDPWLDDAYLQLGRTLVRLKRPEVGQVLLERYQAAEGYRKAIQDVLSYEFQGEEGMALLSRARAEKERGRFFDAMCLLNQAVQKAPLLGPSYVELARLSLFLERPGDAIPVLEKLTPQAEFLEVLGEAYQASGELEKARKAYREALGKGIEEPEGVQQRLAAVEARLALGGEAAPESELETIRKEVREGLRGLPLSRSTGELLRLAEAYRRAGRIADARHLTLFLFRLRPRESRCAQAVAREWDGADQVFLRLWALTFLGESGRPSFREQLQGLGLDPDRVRAALAGEALADPTGATDGAVES